MKPTRSSHLGTWPCAIAVFLIASITSTPAVEVILQADRDTFLRSGADNTNEGGSPFLRIKASGDNRALLHFSQSQLEAALVGHTLVSATLQVLVADDANNWGKDGEDRTIGVHRMTMDWAEGNGINSETPTRLRDRGTGPGATWSMAVDLLIENGRLDFGTEWEMARKGPNPFLADPTATSVITNSLLEGTVVNFDVTPDVAAFLTGTPNNGWTIKKSNEGESGHLLLCSREYNAASTSNPSVFPALADNAAPLLILNLQQNVRDPVDLYAVKDAFMRGGSQDLNEGSNPAIRLKSSGPNRGVVAFNLTPELADGVTRATLSVTVKDLTDNWGTTGIRTVDVHRFLTNWTEGNGLNQDVPGPSQNRGSGSGVTWNAPTDTAIENTATDALGGVQWRGGKVQPDTDPDTFHYAPATATGVPHMNDIPALTVLSWDVTADVQAGAGFGWLLKKTNEGQNGQVHYYSREGAATAGHPEYAPKLHLEYTP